MLYKTSNKDLVYKEIKKLKPLNYNQFKWWRRFDTKSKPLPKDATFLQRIQNGEYEFSHYFWQWKLTEIELNDAYEKYNGNIQMMLEKNGVDFARRKRLMEDFNKDEADRLEALKKGFLREFDMTSDDYENSLLKFDGTTEEFLNDKTLSAIETVDGHNLIVNVYVNDICYGLNVDMSNVVAGTTLTKREDFIVDGDMLIVDTLSLDIAKTEMLG